MFMTVNRIIIQALVAFEQHLHCDKIIDSSDKVGQGAFLPLISQITTPTQKITIDIESSKMYHYRVNVAPSKITIQYIKEGAQ